MVSALASRGGALLRFADSARTHWCGGSIGYRQVWLGVAASIDALGSGVVALRGACGAPCCPAMSSCRQCGLARSKGGTLRQCPTCRFGFPGVRGCRSLSEGQWAVALDAQTGRTSARVGPKCLARGVSSYRFGRWLADNAAGWCSNCTSRRRIPPSWWMRASEAVHSRRSAGSLVEARCLSRCTR